MVEVDIDVGRKRRLPPWMLGVTTDQVRKSGQKDENNPSLEVQTVSQALLPKAIPVSKRLEKEAVLCEKEASEVDSSLLVKCEIKERVRKSRRQDVDHDSSIPSEVGIRKKRAKKNTDGVGTTVQEPTPKKRNPKNYGLRSREDIKAPSPIEGDGELTIEDLMSIAEEYVKADKGKEHQQAATTEPESETQLPKSSVFSRNESVGSIGAAQSSVGLPTNTTIGPTYNFTKTRLKDQESSTSESITMGDPTQDMLDLFLGPLLKKPLTEERKLDLVPENITFDCDFRKQSQSEVLGEKVVPLMKKKSSLKDKVAMFLD